MSLQGAVFAIAGATGGVGSALARRIRAEGGRVLTQAGASCVIDGMPRSVREAGLAARDVPLAELAAVIVDELGASRREAPRPPP